MKNNITKACETDVEHILEDKGQPPLWPFNIVEGMWFLSKCFLRHLYLTIKKLKEKELNNKEIAQLFKNPSRISDLFHLDQFCFTTIPKGEGIKLIDDLVDFIGCYREEDIFCKTGKNIIWSKNQVKEALNNFDIIRLGNKKEDEKIRKVIGKINTTLWLYTELITAAHHAYGHEFHGPYSVGNNNILVVREYYDLKMPEVWPFTTDMQFNKVLTLEIYDKRVKIDFDAFNHTHSSTSLPSNLKGVLVGINDFDHPIRALSEFKNLLETLEGIIAKANEFISNFDKKDWTIKLLEIHYYSLKPHKKVLGEDWRPSEEIYDFIQNRKPDCEFIDFMQTVGKIKEGKVSRSEAFNILRRRFLKNVRGDCS